MIQIAGLSGSGRSLDDWLERRRAADAALDPEATAAAAAVLADVRELVAAALIEYANQFERRTVAWTTSPRQARLIVDKAAMEMKRGLIKPVMERLAGAAGA